MYINNIVICGRVTQLSRAYVTVD